MIQLHLLKWKKDKAKNNITTKNKIITETIIIINRIKKEIGKKIIKVDNNNNKTVLIINNNMIEMNNLKEQEKFSLKKLIKMNKNSNNKLTNQNY